MDVEGHQERAPQGEGPRQDGPCVPHGDDREAGEQGQADRAHDRAARRSRSAAQGVEAAVLDRRGAAFRRPRRATARRDRTARHVHARACRPRTARSRSRRDHGPQRRRQEHVARAHARPHRANFWHGDFGLRRRDRRDRPSARCVRRRAADGDRVWPSRAGHDRRGRAHVAREVRPRRAIGASHRRLAFARRTHARSDGVAASEWRQPARARRADQPPRPRGDRTVGASARVV